MVWNSRCLNQDSLGQTRMVGHPDDDDGAHPRPILFKRALLLNSPNPLFPHFSFPGSFQGSEPIGAA